MGTSQEIETSDHQEVRPEGAHNPYGLHSVVNDSVRVLRGNAEGEVGAVIFNGVAANAERVMTVAHTARKQQRDVLSFLTDCCRAHAHGTDAPSLFTASVARAAA